MILRILLGAISRANDVYGAVITDIGNKKVHSTILQCFNNDVARSISSVKSTTESDIAHTIGHYVDVGIGLYGRYCGVGNGQVANVGTGHSHHSRSSAGRVAITHTKSHCGVIPEAALLTHIGHTVGVVVSAGEKILDVTHGQLINFPRVRRR